jgi:hypothetical protein
VTYIIPSTNHAYPIPRHFPFARFTSGFWPRLNVTAGALVLWFS